MSHEAPVPRPRGAEQPPTPLNLSAEFDSSDSERIFRAILSLYKLPHPQYPARAVLDRFHTHPDPRVRMAAVDGVFAEALRGSGDPNSIQSELLAELLPRFQRDTYVLRCLINRAVQKHLTSTAPTMLSLIGHCSRPDWLINCYGALYPYQGYAPLRDVLVRHMDAPWASDAIKFLYRLDAPAAHREFPRYLPDLPDKRLWRVLEFLGPEMTTEFVPLLERLVAERDPRVRRVCVAILRWLVGQERALESFGRLVLPDGERQELEAIASGARPGRLEARPTAPRP